MIVSRLTASAAVFAVAATAAVFQLAMPAAHGVIGAESMTPVVQLERVIVTGKATNAATARL